MSGAIVARAPGKLFILGEYAVLDGCPAIVAAIDRHVEVRLQGAAQGTRVQISSLEHGRVEFSAARPPEIDGPLRFVIAAFRTTLSRCPEIGDRGCSLSIGGSITEADGVKVGLGSSAAVTVATTAALLAGTGAPIDRDHLFAIALEAHRIAQGGVGSGADVAASVYGGMIRFEPVESSLPNVMRLAVPAPPMLLVAWSGESARTADLVRRYLSATNGSAAARAAFVATARRSVGAFVDGLAGGQLCDAAINGNGDALARLGEDLGLPILTQRLRQLIAIARVHGAAAKTSGAGNGDCGIALTRDATAAARILEAWRAAQLVPLDVAVDQTGVTVGRG